VEIAPAAVVALQKLRCYNGLMKTISVQSLSDEQLLREVEAAAAHERDATVELITLLGEMDARRLYLQQGYSSLFTYCTGCLRLSEHAAYGRIEAARASRKFPIILECLADGSITLTTICLLSSHLTSENHRQLLTAARHKTRREVEQLVATLRPMADVPSTVRKLPQAAPLMVTAPEDRAIEPAPVVTNSTVVSTPEQPAVARPSAPPIVQPIAPERYKVQFTIGPETHRKLRKLQDLMRHTLPNGDIADIFDRAVTVLLRQVERQKLARVTHPRSLCTADVGRRHVPSSVKRAVWERDKEQCAFVGTKGRCEERGFLEFHHVIPFAEGGPATVENLQLRCRRTMTTRLVITLDCRAAGREAEAHRELI